MKTLRPSNSELAAVAQFERLIATVGEAQARLRNLQTAVAKPMPTIFEKTTAAPYSTQKTGV